MTSLFEERGNKGRRSRRATRSIRRCNIRIKESHRNSHRDACHRSHAAAGGAEKLASTGIGFESPFEDEYDTPAFLRKRGGSMDDDGDIPAFMRRGGSD